MDRGKTWHVDQTVEIDTDGPAPSKAADGTVAGARTSFKITEKWSDYCDSEEARVVKVVKRTYSSSKLKVGKTPGVSDIELCGFTITPSEAACTAAANKGKPQALTTRLLEMSPPELCVLLLPPGGANRTGAAWMVPAGNVRALQLTAMAGVGSVRGPAREALLLDLERLDAGGGQGALATLVNAKIVNVTARNIAQIKYAGEAALEDSRGTPGNTDIKLTAEGSLDFDMVEGRPVKLEWREVLTIPALKVDGVEQQKGWQETLTINRTYK